MQFQAVLNDGTQVQLTKINRTTFKDAEGTTYVFPADIRELRA